MNSSSEQTLTGAFARQAELHPSQIAVRDADGEITYAELNRRADSLAAKLLDTLGPGAEPVAVLLDQDVSFMISILGIMKAGKSFCPVDPVYPQPRIHYMLENLGARIVVTNGAYDGVAAAAHASPTRLLVEEADSWPANLPAASGPSPKDLAWIIYTSGSTGRPKGVTQNHANAVRMTRDYSRATGITSADRLTLLHPALTWDIFGALLNGACIYPYDIRKRGIAGIGEWLRRERITLYRSFTTTYRKVVDSLGDTVLEDVRLIHVSGEIVTPRDIEHYKRHFPDDCLLMVIFGSSEAGLVTAQRVGKDSEFDGPVPVGRPFDGVEFVLLDSSGSPVERGEVGEIGVRSRHVFPGYWHRDDLNRTAFLDNSVPEEERVFLTGDLGRLGADGSLYYAGRKDSQVKVRGYRIELAEVELALESIDEIKDAAAKAVEDAEGDKRLVAYLVFRGSDWLSPAELRSRLEGAIPHFMIPSVFVSMEKLPSTPNGKLDRNALPDPGRARPELSVTLRPPATPVERKLAAIWQSVLGIDEIGVDDEFLELGGDSLMAQQIVSRVRQMFNRDFPISHLLGASTITQMATLI